MNWLMFQLYRLGCKWPYLRWRIYRVGVEERQLREAVHQQDLEFNAPSGAKHIDCEMCGTRAQDHRGD